MSFNSPLVGYETQPKRHVVIAKDVSDFAAAIGDHNQIYDDLRAAHSADLTNIPTPPTFIARFQSRFDRMDDLYEQIGLQTKNPAFIHTNQEYIYARPLLIGDIVDVRCRLAFVHRFPPPDNFSMIAFDYFCDTPGGENIITGKASYLLQETVSNLNAVKPSGKWSSSAQIGNTERQQTNSFLVKHVSQAQINSYADASGDHNPIHLDPAAAQTAGLDGTIAHGMLTMAFLGQLLTPWLATATTSGSYIERLKASFQGMVRPEDTLNCYSRLGKHDTQRQHVKLWIENQHGERVTSGDATIILR